MLCCGGMKLTPEHRNPGEKQHQCHLINHKSHTFCTGIEGVNQTNFHEEYLRLML